MENGVIAKWHKVEGDKVESGDLLLEITTDKATVEHNALDEGFLRKIIVQEGQSAAINQGIAVFTETEDESIEGYQPEGLAPAAPEKEASAEQDSSESEKTAPTKTVAQPTSTMAQPAFEPEPPIEDYDSPFATFPKEGKVLASPLAKKIAKEKGLDLKSIKGSGPRGRIMKDDLEFAQSSGASSFGLKSLPEFAPGSYEEEPLSAVQEVVGARLQASKSFIPHFYINQNVDAGPIMRVRSELKAQGIKVSFNDFVVRASALALKEHPKINSGFNSVKQSLIRFKTVDISIAVSLEEGLITPIVRYADYKNLGQISSEVKYLAKRAREGKLAMEEFKGGSFTISNLGMYGVTDLKPVINPPQAAILGVGGLQEVPRMKEGQWVLGHQMTLTLAADHRAVNGEDGAKFMKTLKELLENPSILLI